MDDLETVEPDTQKKTIHAAEQTRPVETLWAALGLIADMVALLECSNFIAQADYRQSA